MQVDQALFGYSRGHRRLTSSFGMPQSEERLLVRMTDLSGSRIAEGFEDYVSGYSLGRPGRYVIAKTWYAPECERPGCVWTQVLFLTPDVWSVVTSDDVLGAFRRPENISEDLDWYSQKLQIRRQAEKQATDENTRQALCAAVYLSGKTVVALAASGSCQIESVVLEMLWQRPAPLREALSFCTGALSFLKVDERPLRLQVMPARAGRTLREQDISLINLDMPDMSVSDPVSGFIAKDLQERRQDYRRFLADMTQGWGATDEPGASAAMFAISETFLIRRAFLAKEIPISQMFEKVAALRASEDAQSLQLSSVLLKELQTIPAAWFYVESVLAGQTDAKKFGAEFTSDAAHKAAAHNPRKAIDLIRLHLYSGGASEFHGEVIQGLLRAIDLGFLTEIRPVEPQILVRWAKLHPDELRDSRFWLLQHSFGESAEIAEALEETFSESVVLQALLHADRFDLLLSLLRVQGREGAQKAFDLARNLDLSVMHDRLKLNALRDGITVHADYVTKGEALQITPGQLFLLGSTHLNATQLFRVARQPSVWREVLGALNGKFDRLHATAFELAILNDGWWQVAEQAFGPLYEQAAAREIAYEEWSALKRVLPKVGGWEKWDKCERLRRALIRVLRRDRISLAQLILLRDDIRLQLRRTEDKYSGDW